MDPMHRELKRSFSGLIESAKHFWDRITVGVSHGHGKRPIHVYNVENNLGKAVTAFPTTDESILWIDRNDVAHWMIRFPLLA